MKEQTGSKNSCLIKVKYKNLPKKDQNQSSHSPNKINSLLDNNIPKLSQNSYSIENLLGSKKRLHNLQAIRNGIQIISPGDKLYKSVEFQKDHFKQLSKENKISNVNKFNFYSDVNNIKESLNPDKLWINRKIKESLEIDTNYIKNLIQWEEKYLTDNKTKKLKIKLK